LNKQPGSFLCSLIQWIPNALSLARLALGLGFVFLPPSWRIPVVALAAATDLLDGPLSRRLQAETSTGRLLDPLADKVFAFAVVGTVLADGTLAWWQALLVVLRDLSVLVGVAVIVLRNGWQRCQQLRPTLLGKAVTAAQFVFFLTLLVFSQVFLPLFIVTAALSAAAAVDYARRSLARQP
jgi:CDP-diacylglycerol--glycerol-3-phosphate 3-phosphatidyltransferase/cardiolipin synthase